MSSTRYIMSVPAARIVAPNRGEINRHHIGPRSQGRVHIAPRGGVKLRTPSPPGGAYTKPTVWACLFRLGTAPQFWLRGPKWCLFISPRFGATILAAGTDMIYRVEDKRTHPHWGGHKFLLAEREISFIDFFNISLRTSVKFLQISFPSK